MERWGRLVTYDPTELAALNVAIHDVDLDPTFPEGTTKKIQPNMSGIPWPVVDLHHKTCTCDKWLEHGQNAPRNTPRRLCRHILTYLLKVLPDGSHGHLEGMLADDRAMTLTEIRELRLDGNHLCWVGLTEPEARFLSVYARNRRKDDIIPPGTGRVKACRLSKTGDRWGYGEAPFGAGQIKMALAAAGIWRP